uniref:Thiamine biosynthesis protein ThiF n=1 Tax=Paracidobacterium acidisoli TaxID=2303751 RepID=A0A372IJP3_9BACT
MTDALFAAPGESVAVDTLVGAHAQGLARHLVRQINPYARFVEARVAVEGADRIETIVFDVDVELSQITKFDIHPTERISVSFPPKNDAWPEVLALRQNFPVVPHLYLRPVEFPRSLCLYEEAYSEGQLRWTAVSIVERIRTWLSETAQGALHKDDQPLEPLFLGTRDTIVLPADIYAKTALGPTQLLIARVDRKPWGEIYIARYLAGGVQGQGAAFVAATYFCPPVLHGVMNWTPQTLSDLQSASIAARGDLVTSLRDQLSNWPRESWLLACHLALIVFFPKAREVGHTVEALETRVFVTNPTVGEIGEILGIWQLNNGVPGHVIGGTIDHERLDHITLVPLNPTFALDRQRAASINGSAVDLRRISAVGMGALGSQIANLLARSGYGKWSLVDSDVLLPHNFARHALVHSLVGMSKVDAMKMHLDMIIAEPIVEGVVFADVLNAGEKEDDIRRVLEAADAILDFSASVPVARKLALETFAQGRRASVFMNPSGSSSILLCEDAQRLTRLDSLEMQYYRAILSRTELGNHFAVVPRSIRYGTSCRDVSNTLPAHRVALHAALTSAAIKKALSSDGACIRVWIADEEDAVQALQIPPEDMIERQIGDWKLVTDRGLLNKLKLLRLTGLPAETGGVLLGTWDLTSRIVYIADTIPAPPDSKKRVTSFIRGCEGLLDKVAHAGRATSGMLQYVGEWHSHPNGFGTGPSGDDRKVFEWITEKATEDGYQPVMAIVGELEARWFVESISSQQNVDLGEAK